MTEDRDERWIRSKYCGGVNSTCVEVAMGVDQVDVRDGKDHSGPVLRLPAVQWCRFLRGVQVGDFTG